ncbi:hypothetical protein [Rickettsia endosymbiont of Orchestes rusci]|uniref:hypothetical protein n=1 Tax=Rickettsia endosymbiont of Orchestes rusci TaxID=3066250 RepID=UPI00313D488E
MKYGEEYLQGYKDWEQLPEAVKRVPKEFTPRFVKKNVGLRYTDGKNHIRIDKGRPELIDYPPQQVDHITITDNGNMLDEYANYLEYDQFNDCTKVVDRNTGRILEILNGKPSIQPHSHIPLIKWLKWNSWNRM